VKHEPYEEEEVDRALSTHRYTFWRSNLMNTITGSLKKLILNLPRFSRGDWWVEVTTADPRCVYYFGPFLNSGEAFEMRPGYVQDLLGEGAQEVSTVIKRCCPTELTRCSEND
jgi:Domain of unknown function (DUF1816)